MIDLDCLFPKAEGRPFTLRNAFTDLPCQNGSSDSKQDPPKASDLKIKRWEETKRGENHPERFSLMRLDWNKPAPTIQKTATGSTGAMHPDEPRELFTGELKRIAGFPDCFFFVGKWEYVLARIGNSVPPLLMRAIARQIRHVMFDGEKPVTQTGKNKYLDILEAAWQDHLKPREPGAPTVISTFAGAGGSSLGYSMAGYRELLAVEWDDNAVETFKLNFPGVPVYHDDIAKLSVDKVLEMTGLQPGELDVLDGSPPCQGFSTAGKRMMDDPRNQLFREYVRLLRGLKPKVFVMENVSGMVKGKMKLIFAEILRELKASGYRVSARLLNAMYFNVPQSRQRMIFIGVRDDLGIEPSHPGAEGCEIPMRGLIPDSVEGIVQFRKGKNDKTHNYKDVGRAAPTIDKSGGHIEVGGKRTTWPHETAKRLASFPAHFVFVGNDNDRRERIGNSVPPCSCDP